MLRPSSPTLEEKVFSMPGCLPEDDILVQAEDDELPLPSPQGSNAALAAWIERRLRRDLAPIHDKLDKVLDQAFTDGRGATAGGKSRRNSTFEFNGRRASMEFDQAAPSKPSGAKSKRFSAWSGSSMSGTEHRGTVLSGLELVLSPPRHLRKSGTSMTLGAITKPDKKDRRKSKGFLDTFGLSTPAAPSAAESCMSSVNPSEFVRQVSEDQIVATSESLKPQWSREKPEDSGTTGSFQRALTEKDLARAEHLLNRFQTRRSARNTAQLAWEFIDSPESSHAAKAFATVAPLFILMAVLVTLWQTQSTSPLYGVHAAVIETTIDSLFLLEVVLRFLCCPSRWVFFLDAFNIIDLLAAGPLFIRAASGFVLPRGEVSTVPHAILLCAVPIVRLLKTLRRFEKFRLILNAFHLAAEALPVLLFILAMIALSFAMMIYLAEPRDNVTTIPTSLWLTLITMFTVGYGDVTPTTSLGQQFTGALIIVTALYMSIPIGIIGHAFTVTWNNRDKILLMQRTRDRLRQWGYSASDIPALFRLSAHSPDGGLNMRDFRNLLTRMQIGLTEERMLQLFQSFDVDHTGSVGDREFVRHLFPSAYEEIYGNHNIYVSEAEQDEPKDTQDAEAETDGKT